MAVPAGWRGRVRLQSGDLRTEDTARCDIVVAAERATLVSIVSLRRLSLPGWTRVLGPPAPSDGALYTIKGGAWSLAQAEGLLCDSECESAGAPAARTPHAALRMPQRCNATGTSTLRCSARYCGAMG